MDYKIVLLISIVCLMIAGCSGNRISLNDELVSVETDDSKIEVLWTDVYEQDGQAWIYGVLKQKAINTGLIKAHVDVWVLGSDGSVQNRIATDELTIPRNLIGKGPNVKRFRVKLPDRLPEDYQISMNVHSSLQMCELL